MGQTFLTNRKQRVKLNGFVSDWRAVNGGVPQGTALGPIHFLVMVNDVLNDWKDRWKYVDDTSASETVTPQTNSTLQLLVDEVVSWTSRNNMKLNVSKREELIVQFSKDKLSFAPLVIEGTPVEVVDLVKILGLTIQNDMKWHKHIHNIITKAGKRLYMLRLLKRAKAYQNTMKIVFTAIIRPVLEYAVQVWHYNIRNSISDEIESLQKRALRIILPNHYAEALNQLDLETLQNHRENLSTKFFQNILGNACFQDYLPERNAINYELRHLGLSLSH